MSTKLHNITTLVSSLLRSSAGRCGIMLSLAMMMFALPAWATELNQPPHLSLASLMGVEPSLTAGTF
ncbi:MAG: hypothetical protein K2Q32_04685, partial [Alphaproteobacteria bacterium]|nr:hypothetical protein [Alphaproteobacteria bacterium]